MRLGARLLHVLLSAPVALLLAAVCLPPSAARADSGVPAPYVVAIDAGHGGAPDNGHPGQPFDPGVVAADGTMEKDITLDVARRLRTLLEGAGATVVMTRDSDAYVEISRRMEIATSAGARLFVSIHMNSFPDPSTRGSVVLYPNDASQGFATAVSGALQRGLAGEGVPSAGALAHPELWVHAPMPAVTVEGAYLTNPADLALLRRGDFRQHLAQTILSGIGGYDPRLEARHQALLRWENENARSALGLARAGGGGPPPLAVAGMVVGAVILRRPLLAGARGGLALAWSAAGPGRGRAKSRKSRAQKRRAALARSRRRNPHDQFAI
jgi:N-acetylmuramoyl-L-alanine amidase